MPAQLARLVPYLTVDGCARALEFYKAALGAEVVHTWPAPDGRLAHVDMRVGGSTVYLSDDFPEHRAGERRDPLSIGGTPVMLYQGLDHPRDVDAAIDRAARAGATVVMPAADQYWGDHYGQVRDPFGHVWSFGAPITKA